MRQRTTRGYALAVVGVLAAESAWALRLVPGTLTTDVTEVFLTRSITVRALLEDDLATGADNMQVEVMADPPQAVRPIGGRSPVALTCSPVGASTAGSWVF